MEELHTDSDISKIIVNNMLVNDAFYLNAPIPAITSVTVTNWNRRTGMQETIDNLIVLRAILPQARTRRYREKVLLALTAKYSNLDEKQKYMALYYVGEIIHGMPTPLTLAEQYESFKKITTSTYTPQNYMEFRTEILMKKKEDKIAFATTTLNLNDPEVTRIIVNNILHSLR